MTKHTASDDRSFNFGKLKGECVLDVPLFGRRHGAIELARLTVMIGEALGPEAQLLSCLAFALLLRKSAKSALGTTSIRRMPSRCKFRSGQRGRLIGSSWKFAPPSRLIWVSV
jgi:hypothetical protein